MADTSFITIPQVWCPTISCEQSFPAGHRLPNHEGACKYIHGHNYKLRVELGHELRKTTRTGYAIDFSELRRMVRAVTDKYDHAFFVWADDHLLPMLTAAQALEDVWKPVILQAPPSAEVIAAVLLQQLEIELRLSGIAYFSLRITLWETENSAVTLEGTR